MTETLLALQVVADAPAFQIDPMTITLIGGMVVTIIGTIVTGIVTVITAMRVNTAFVRQHTDSQRLVSMAIDTEAIKGHVNSEKTAANGREAVLQQENRLLREMIADRTATASLLAQATATRSMTRTTDPAAPIPVEVVNVPLLTSLDDREPS